MKTPFSFVAKQHKTLHGCLLVSNIEKGERGGYLSPEEKGEFTPKKKVGNFSCVSTAFLHDCRMITNTSIVLMYNQLQTSFECTKTGTGLIDNGCTHKLSSHFVMIKHSKMKWIYYFPLLWNRSTIMIINTFYNNSHVPCLKASSSYSLLLLRKRRTELGNLMCEELQEVNFKKL